MVSQTQTERHAHFGPDQASGSHRSPNEFRQTRNVGQQKISSDYFSKSVPFYYDWLYINDNSFWSGRIGAILTLGKSVAYTLIENIHYLYTSIFNTAEKPTASEHSHAQWIGLKLNLEAIWSPRKFCRLPVDHIDPAYNELERAFEQPSTPSVAPPAN